MMAQGFMAGSFYEAEHEAIRHPAHSGKCRVKTRLSAPHVQLSYALDVLLRRRREGTRRGCVSKGDDVCLFTFGRVLAVCWWQSPVLCSCPAWIRTSPGRSNCMSSSSWDNDSSPSDINLLSMVVSVSDNGAFVSLWLCTQCSMSRNTATNSLPGHVPSSNVLPLCADGRVTTEWKSRDKNDRRTQRRSDPLRGHAA